jgi:hypothetical protein
MEYICSACDYSTNEICNYKRHLNSKKHSKNNKSDLNECEYCEVVYSSPSSLSRHRKNCNKKIKNEDSTEVNLYKKIIDILEKDKDTLEKDKDKLEKDKDMLIKMLDDYKAISKPTVSAIVFVNANYVTAPGMVIFTDCKLIHKNRTVDQFVQDILYHYKNDHLAEYIGDYLIKTYKKENPHDQSIWNSDTSRMTYVTMESLENKKKNWMIDKKGIRTNEYIIEPMLKYVNQVVSDYVDILSVRIDLTESQIADKIEKNNMTAAIKKSIQIKKLNDEILRYIAPHFFLEKNLIKA